MMFRHRVKCYADRKQKHTTAPYELNFGRYFKFMGALFLSSFEAGGCKGCLEIRSTPADPCCAAAAAAASLLKQTVESLPSSPS